MRNKLQPCSLLFSELSFYPLHHHGHGIMLFLIGQFSTGRYTMPFFETTSATTPGGMLSYKHGMPAHGSLFTIVGNHGRSQSFTNKIGGMTGNRIHSFFFQICCETGTVKVVRKGLPNHRNWVKPLFFRQKSILGITHRRKNRFL